MIRTSPSALADDAVAAYLSDDQELPSLARALEALRADPVAVRAWLGALASDPDVVHEVARRSYWHPNGFAKLILRDGAGHGGTVRLHVWPRAEDDGTPRGDSNAHGHRWDFASAVIVGAGLHATHFVDDAAGSRYEHYRFRGVTHPLRPAGHARLRSTEHKVRPHDDLYVCGTDVVHTIDPCGRDLVATLMVQGPILLEETSVYLRPGKNREAASTPVTEDEVRGRLADVIDAL